MKPNGPCVDHYTMVPTLNHSKDWCVVSASSPDPRANDCLFTYLLFEHRQCRCLNATLSPRLYVSKLP